MTKKCTEGIVIKSFSDKFLFLRSVLIGRPQKDVFSSGPSKFGGAVILTVNFLVEILHKAIHMNIFKIY